VAIGSSGSHACQGWGWDDWGCLLFISAEGHYFLLGNYLVADCSYHLCHYLCIDAELYLHRYAVYGGYHGHHEATFIRIRVDPYTASVVLSS
jgi:hypothetical protein